MQSTMLYLECDEFASCELFAACSLNFKMPSEIKVTAQPGSRVFCASGAE
jgi:hypothetical protein